MRRPAAFLFMLTFVPLVFATARTFWSSPTERPLGGADALVRPPRGNARLDAARGGRGRPPLLGVSEKHRTGGSPRRGFANLRRLPRRRLTSGALRGRDLLDRTRLRLCGCHLE